MTAFSRHSSLREQFALQEGIVVFGSCFFAEKLFITAGYCFSHMGMRV